MITTRLRTALQHHRDDRATLTRLRRDLADLELDRPVSMEQLCDLLATKHQRPIHLFAHPLEVPGPFGLWLATSTSDVIVYQRETTRLHQQHIIAHEVGHLLAEHTSDVGDDAVWAELLPDIPPEVIRRALRRTSYDAPEERQAEMVATMLWERANVAEAVAEQAATARAEHVRIALEDRQDWL